MEGSGLLVFLRLKGENKIVNWSLEEKPEGFYLESERIRYTKYLEAKIYAFVPTAKIPKNGMFLVDLRKGDAYLVDFDREISYKFGITRERPYKLKNVTVRIETRSG